MRNTLLLLQEALQDLDELYMEATSRSGLLYEGMGYSKLQTILIEVGEEAASGDKEGFVKRAAAAVEKLKKAAASGAKDLESLRDKLQAAGMDDTASVFNSAIDDLKKKAPGQSFMSKIGSGASMAVKALFGKEDDPAEAVAEIVADANVFQNILTTFMNTVFELVSSIEPAEAVESAAEDAEGTGEGGELTPEQKEKFAAELKDKVMAGTINDLLENPDAFYEEIRDATGFSAGALKDALRKSVKPATGMMSGLRSLGASLGIGLGGDLPFKKYGMSTDSLINDISLVPISQLQALTAAVAAESGSTDDLEGLQSGLEGLGDAKEEYEDQQAPAQPTPTQPSSPGQQQSPDESAPATSDEPGEESFRQYIDLMTKADMTSPLAASEKFEDLLAADVSFGRTNSLLSLLSEKVLRYDDVVEKMKDHLPQEEEAIPAAVKRLADEMKVELGAEFDIVGLPDSAAQGIEALRDEIRALRALLGELPDDVRDAAEQQISDELVSQGLDPEEAEEVLTTDLDAEALVAAMQGGDINQVMSLLDDSAEQVEELTSEDPEVDDIYLYTVKTGSNKGRVIPVKIQSLRPEDGVAVVLRPNKALNAFTKNTFGAKIADLGEKTTEKEAFSAGVKEESRRIMIAKMRGKILRETNNFVFASSLTRSGVLKEFYHRGGTDEEILSEMKNQPVDIFKRWNVLLGGTSE
jgi:hypothetical protein